MKKIGIIAAAIVISFVLQTSLFNFVQIFGVIPNISLILLVIFSVHTNGIFGAIFGFITGMLYDVMLYDIFGLYTLSYFIIGGVVGTFSDEMNKENYILYCLITLASTIFLNLVIYLVLLFLRYRVDNFSFILSNAFLEAFVNIIFAAIIVKLVLYFFEVADIK